MHWNSKMTGLAVFGFVLSLAYAGIAQESYILRDRVVTVEQPVKRTRLQEETIYETITIEEEVPVIETETRYRKVLTQRPVVKEKILEERFEVCKPVTETSMKTVEIEETVYQEVTEMQSKPTLVQKPVQETRYRDEQVVVKKPVSSVRYEPQQMTTYRPEIQQEVTYTAAQLAAMSPATTHLEWMRRGYYFDPSRNAYIYRRPGFHWVTQPPAVTTQQVLIPQTTAKTVLVPETQTTYKPVVVETMQETIETRRVPYEVTTTKTVMENVEVPVVVRRPVVQRRQEQVPETKTRYETQEVVRRTPIQETTYECVEVDEPYQVQVQKYVKQKRVVQVPKTVIREVPVTTTESVRKVVTERIPIKSASESSTESSIPHSANRSVIDGTTENSASLGEFKPAGEMKVLKGTRLLDPTEEKNEAATSTTTERPNSVLTLETKELRPISERPKPVEADIPPAIEPPKNPK